MIEDDQAEVEAAMRGGFGLVIGLRRSGHARDLLTCGADTVIADLAEVSVRSGGTAMSDIADAVQVYSQLKELVAARRPVGVSRLRRHAVRYRRSSQIGDAGRRCGRIVTRDWPHVVPSR